MKQTSSSPLSPVLFIGFNRPAHTKAVLQRIVDAGVRRIYVSVDGPRSTIQGEAAAVEEVRRTIDAVRRASDAEFLLQVSDENLGCKEAVRSAIDWFFSVEKMGVIVEDDCLPDVTFFAYCSELLARYEADRRVAMISGSNLLETWPRVQSDYFFADGGAWGWATWRDRWLAHDPEMAAWQNAAARKRVSDFLGAAYFERSSGEFARSASGDLDSWDFQWAFARALAGGLTAIPSRNLVSNIGFGKGATHTLHETSFSRIQTHPISQPLRHPEHITFDRAFQAALLDKELSELRPSITRRLSRRVKRAKWWKKSAHLLSS